MPNNGASAKGHAISVLQARRSPRQAPLYAQGQLHFARRTLHPQSAASPVMNIISAIKPSPAAPYSSTPSPIAAVACECWAYAQNLHVLCFHRISDPFLVLLIRSRVLVSPSEARGDTFYCLTTVMSVVKPWLLLSATTAGQVRLSSTDLEIQRRFVPVQAPSGTPCL